MSDQRDPYDILDEANTIVNELTELLNADTDKQSLLNKTEALRQKLSELPNRAARDQAVARVSDLDDEDDTIDGGNEDKTVEGDLTVDGSLKTDSIEGADPELLPAGDDTPVGGEGSDSQPGAGGTDTIEGGQPGGDKMETNFLNQEELEKLTIPKLKEYAKERNIEIPADANFKVEIVDVIVKASPAPGA